MGGASDCGVGACFRTAMALSIEFDGSRRSLEYTRSIAALFTARYSISYWTRVTGRGDRNFGVVRVSSLRPLSCHTDLRICLFRNTCVPITQKKKPQIFRPGVSHKSLTITYFHKRNANYHRRKSVSRSCSGWEGVVPPCYGHQA